MKINFYPVNYISYQGKLKDNLRTAEKELKEFKEEFPYLKSSTLWQQRQVKIGHDKKKRIGICTDKIYGFADDIVRLRERIYRYCIRPHTESECAKYIKERVKKEKCGNCGEITQIISYNLDKKGIKHEDVEILVKKGINAGKTHVFSIIDLDKDADLSKPKTWGKNAVVIDGWRGFALSVPDAIREYENLYCTKRTNKGSLPFLFQDGNLFRCPKK